MKTCKKCQQSKSVNDFYVQWQVGAQGQRWKYYDCYCKLCRGQYASERRRNIKKQAVEYLGGQCMDCQLKTDQYEVYDFHHKDPKAKDFSIGKQAKAFDSIRIELDKCILLCANCHRVRHGM